MDEALLECESYCLGILGWTEREFWDSSLGAILRAIRRREKYDNDRDELALSMWRIQVADFRNVHRGEDDSPTQLTDVVRLPSDEKDPNINAPGELTEYQQQQVNRFYQRQLQKLGDQHEHKTDG